MSLQIAQFEERLYLGDVPGMLLLEEAFSAAFIDGELPFLMMSARFLTPSVKKIQFFR